MTELSSVQHFKSVCLKTYNKIVKEHFKEIDTKDDNDISTPETSLRKACLIDNEDSAILINNRMMLFYFVLRKAQDLQPIIAGIPYESYQENFKFKPQITLKFLEKYSDTDDGYSQLSARLTIRIYDERYDTLKDAKINQIKNKINAVFGGKTPYSFKKGKIYCHYLDKEKGIKLSGFFFNKSIAKDLFDKALSIIGLNPDWSLFNASQNDKESLAYPVIPKSERILGENRKLPRKRPVGTVHFREATLEVYGIKEPIVLYQTLKTTYSKYLN